MIFHIACAPIGTIIIMFVVTAISVTRDWFVDFTGPGDDPFDRFTIVGSVRKLVYPPFYRCSSSVVSAGGARGGFTNAVKDGI